MPRKAREMRGDEKRAKPRRAEPRIWEESRAEEKLVKERRALVLDMSRLVGQPEGKEEGYT